MIEDTGSSYDIRDLLGPLLLANVNLIAKERGMSVEDAIRLAISTWIQIVEEGDA